MHLNSNFLILHPAVHVCDVKPSEATTVRHFATNSQFSCTYPRDSKPCRRCHMNSSQALTSLVGRGCCRLAGTFDRMGLALGCKSTSQLPVFICFGACVAIIFVCLNVFTGRFSNLALIFLRRMSFMVQISRRVILMLEIMQTGFGQENGLRTPPTISIFQID